MNDDPKPLSHVPPSYDCPFCKVAKSEYDDYTTEADIVFSDENTVAFVGSRWWLKNEGSVVVIPKQHFENIYTISEEALCQTQRTVKAISRAMKEVYNCDGVSSRQHNEPAGDQDVWHYHVHVFPRFDGDDLYANHYQNRRPTAQERKEYADKLKAYFQSGVEEAIEYFNTHYPGKNIVKLPEDNPTEIICEVDPTSAHPESNRAIAAIKKSAPHYHKLSVETYKVLQGKLTLTVDEGSAVLNEGDEYVIQPGQVHHAEGEFTIVQVDSSPGWTPDDHFLA